MSNITITVPKSMEDRVCKYIQQLTMEELSLIENDKDQESIEELAEVEVEDVLDAKLISGKWKFLLKFKGDWSQNTEWVYDEDCYCEELISRFCHANNIRTAYCYCRVSTKEQADLSHVSLESQAVETTGAIRECGIKFDRIKIVNDSCSAFKSVPNKLIDIATACNESDAIFVWRVDRLTRNIRLFMDFVKNNLNPHTLIRSVADNISYTGHEDQISFMQEVLNAQKESVLISKRVKDSHSFMKARGDHAIGSLPYGKRYERIVDDKGVTIRKEVVVNQEEVDIISRIKDMNKDKSHKTIASILNNENILKRGHKWSNFMIKYILTRNK